MRLTRRFAVVTAITLKSSPQTAATGGDVPTAAASANPTFAYGTDHVIGYAIESGNTYPALCYVDNTFTSVSGTIAACAATTGTMGALGYQFCSEQSMSLYLAQVVTRGGRASTSMDSFVCEKPCSTVTIYDAYPSASPSFEMGICANDGGVAGMAPNLPQDVKVLYRHIPAAATAAASSASGSSSPTGSSFSSGSSTSSASQGQHSSNNTPVIVGSVIGGVAGIGLIAGTTFLAFYCGRRRGSKRNAPEAPPMHQDGTGKAELGSDNVYRLGLAAVPVAVPELQSDQKHELPACAQTVTEVTAVNPVPHELPTSQPNEQIPRHVATHFGAEPRQ